MALISSAQYDHMLAAAGGGVTVTLGSVTVPCMLAGEDSPILQDLATRKMWGTPVSVTSRPHLVTVKTGALSALAEGVTVTIQNAQYVVDSVLHLRNDDLTHFLAYPVPA